MVIMEIATEMGIVTVEKGRDTAETVTAVTRTRVQAMVTWRMVATPGTMALAKKAATQVTAMELKEIVELEETGMVTETIIPVNEIVVTATIGLR